MTDRIDIERFKANLDRQINAFNEAFKFHGLDKKPVVGRLIDLDAIINAQHAIDVMKAMILKPKADGKDMSAQEQRIKALELGIYRTEELYGFVTNTNRKMQQKDVQIMYLSAEVEKLKKENETLNQIINTEI